MNIKGGFGATVEIKNNGDQTVDDFPVEIVVRGGILKKIKTNMREAISGLAPDTTMSLKTGSFIGLGKITVFVVGDGIIAYKHGIQLFMFTIIR